MIKYNEAVGGKENENKKKQGLTSGNKIKLWKLGIKNGVLTAKLWK
jgi:hypothetical protein